MKRFFALATLFVTSTALAHAGHDVGTSLMAGLLHPLTGVDHLIALASVGALLAFTSGRARWFGTVSLLVSLAVGAGAGLAGIVLPWSEFMIALSVLVAGVMLVQSYRTGRVRSGLLIAGTAVFALFHGYAHGVEVTGDAGAFVSGFLAMSLVIVISTMRCAKFASRAAFKRRAQSS